MTRRLRVGDSVRVIPSKSGVETHYYEYGTSCVVIDTSGYHDVLVQGRDYPYTQEIERDCLELIEEEVAAA